ncbi:MAG: outer membrane protein assembly factor BamD [Geobacteraceae bacterium]|nr:outer membrane protein assembly factor BamD [Geobacteraceae bacterium]
MYRRAVFALCILAFSASCASDKGIKVPPETSYQRGEKLYARKKYEKAAETWRKVKESNTTPLLKTVAELRIADALFQDENYIEAAAEYENFRKLHPKNPNAPYALYMLGVSNFNQVEKIDVDQTPLNNAVTVFESFLQEYPNTEMAKKAREKLAECRAKQAAHEIYVGRFYYRTDKYGAAIGRFSDALEKYPATPVTDEALFLLGDSYLRTGEKEKAREAMARLVKEYPQSRFAGKAKKILERKS